MTLALSQRRGFGWGVALCGMMWHWLKTPRSGGGECCGGRGQGWSSWPSARREEFPHIGIHRTRHGMPQHPCLRPLLLLSNWQSRLLCFGPPLLAASTRLKTQFFYAELFFRALNSGARAEGLFCMQGLTPAFTLSSSPTTASTTPPPHSSGSGPLPNILHHFLSTLMCVPECTSPICYSSCARVLRTALG